MKCSRSFFCQTHTTVWSAARKKAWSAGHRRQPINFAGTILQHSQSLEIYIPVPSCARHGSALVPTWTWDPAERRANRETQRTPHGFVFNMERGWGRPRGGGGGEEWGEKWVSLPWNKRLSRQGQDCVRWGGEIGEVYGLGKGVTIPRKRSDGPERFASNSSAGRVYRGECVIHG